MITASIVLYKTSVEELNRIINCVISSSIDSCFIVDNSPTSILKLQIEKYKTNKLKYIFGQGNVGYGAAHNIAMKKAVLVGTKYHIVLNPDVYFETNVIDELFQYMEKNNEVGYILPKVCYPNGELQRLCKLLPTPLHVFARRFFPEKYRRKLNYKFEMHAMGYDKIWNCPNLSGCFMFMRMSVVQQIHYFDDRFFMYFEDTDLVRRIHQISKTVFYPNVEIIHAHSQAHRYNRKLFYAALKSAVQYFNKWGWMFDRERTVINRNALSDFNKLS